MRLILIAPPGAGKSEQSKRLLKEYNLTYFSTGSFFRHYFKKHRKFREYTKEHFNSGILCDDKTMNAIVNKHIPKDNYILDGYPRTIIQAKFFHSKMCLNNLEYFAVFLNVPEKLSIERLLRRSKIDGRTDDTKETIKKRIIIYKKQTYPLVDYYKKLGILIEQNGIGEIEEIFEKLKRKIDKWK